MLAIIGGTGLTQLPNFEPTHRMIVRTPYGEASGPLTFGHIGDHEIMFLARHGYGHTLAPHEINYRANIWALHEKGARTVLAVSAVGGIARNLPPEMLAVPDQILDFSHSRKNTFFEGADEPVVHIDFTHPYAETVRQRILTAAAAESINVINGGTYACTQGPRLETAAEINMFERLGATMVGMTGMPEAALAREMKLDYAKLCIVANWAAGRGDSSHAVSIDDIKKTLEHGIGRVRQIVGRVAQAYSSK
jgi:5'-methylthioinosine phosphorylase